MGWHGLYKAWSTKFDWSNERQDSSAGQFVGFAPGEPATVLAGLSLVQPAGSVLYGLHRLSTVNEPFAGPGIIKSFGHQLTCNGTRERQHHLEEHYSLSR